MKFRTVMVGAAAAALSFAATGSAAAQTLGHAGQHRAARQITGSRLAKGLLLASAFGSDFTHFASANTGGRLLSTRVRQTPGSLSCGSFAGVIYDSGWGNTAGTYVVYQNPNWRAGWPDTISLGEIVYQFATGHAASTYFNQSYAKFAACRSFSVPNPTDGAPGGGTFMVSATSTSKTSVSGHQAFVNSEYWSPSEGTAFGTPNQDFETLCAVSGTDVYEMWDDSGTTDEPSTKLMSSLIHRVQGLY
jgi:hypothetical protein